MHILAVMHILAAVVPLPGFTNMFDTAGAIMERVATLFMGFAAIGLLNKNKTHSIGSLFGVAFIVIIFIWGWGLLVNAVLAIVKAFGFGG